MIPLHALGIHQEYRPILAVVLVLAGVGAAILTGVGVAAFARRQSRSYLLVVIALAALLGRAFLGGLVMVNVIPPQLHHLIEHTLDAAIAGVLIGAIYFAHTTPDPYRNHVVSPDHTDRYEPKNDG